MEESFNHTLREHLIAIARTGEPIEYAKVAPIAGIDLKTEWGWAHISRELYKVSRYEWDHNRPLLSAVVIGKDGKVPGHGFFTLAREVGRYRGKSELDKLSYWVQEFNEVRDYWRTHTE